MSRKRPASDTISYHEHTNQYYVTRAGKRTYLGSDRKEALRRYHRISLGLDAVERQVELPTELTIKELASRFIAAQKPVVLCTSFISVQRNATCGLDQVLVRALPPARLRPQLSKAMITDTVLSLFIMAYRYLSAIFKASSMSRSDLKCIRMFNPSLPIASNKG